MHFYEKASSVSNSMSSKVYRCNIEGAKIFQKFCCFNIFILHYSVTGKLFSKCSGYLGFSEGMGTWIRFEKIKIDPELSARPALCPQPEAADCGQSESTSLSAPLEPGQNRTAVRSNTWINHWNREPKKSQIKDSIMLYLCLLSVAVPVGADWASAGLERCH